MTHTTPIRHQYSFVLLGNRHQASNKCQKCAISNLALVVPACSHFQTSPKRFVYPPSFISSAENPAFSTSDPL